MKEQEYGTYQEADAQAVDVALPQVGRYRRVPVFAHNRKQSAEELGNPKVSLNRGQRKLIHAARSFRRVFIDRVKYLADIGLPAAPVVAVPQPVKFARKLTKLKLTQLVRRQKKFARLASTAKHILAKMNPAASRLRFGVQQNHDKCLGFFNQVTAEIKARALACEGRLAETTV